MHGHLDKIKLVVLFIFLAITINLMASPLKNDSCSQGNSIKIIDLELAKVLTSLPKNYTIVGKPQIVDCPGEKAVQFDGLGDAIVIDTNLLVNMRQFTIEVIMRPDTNGEREQRFLHFGELRGERVMIETRLTDNGQWYLDAYMKSGQTGQTLKDSLKLHPLNLWYHIAFVVDSGKMEAFVNGKQELQGQIPFSHFTMGRTSIGVRLNWVNWFKGAISRIRITPSKLEPSAFMKF